MHRPTSTAPRAASIASLGSVLCLSTSLASCSSEEAKDGALIPEEQPSENGNTPGNAEETGGAGPGDAGPGGGAALSAPKCNQTNTHILTAEGSRSNRLRGLEGSITAHVHAQPWTSKNEPENVSFMASAWTWEGNPYPVRSLLYFDLPAPPDGATLESAVLILHPGLEEGYRAGGGHSQLTGVNAAHLIPIEEEWNPSSVNWDTSPAVTDERFIELPPSVLPFDVYEVDVSAWASEVVRKERENHGFLLKLVDERPYASLNFASPFSPGAVGDAGALPELHLKWRCADELPSDWTPPKWSTPGTSPMEPPQ